MTAGWSIGEPGEHDRALFVQRFDPSLLSLVVEGHDRAGTWELHDGPHPRTEDPDAVGERLIIRTHDGGAADMGSVGPALSAEQTAIVSIADSGTSRRRHEFLEARCAPQVTTADVEFDDGGYHHVRAITSNSTRQQWIVLAVEPHHRPTRISFYDDAGNLLNEQVVTPRPRHEHPGA